MKQNVCTIYQMDVLSCDAENLKMNVRIIDIKSIDFHVYDTMISASLLDCNTQTLAYIRGAVRKGTVHHQGVM